MLFSLVRVLEVNNLMDKGLFITKEWLKENPNDENLLLLEEYITNTFKIQ